MTDRATIAQTARRQAVADVLRAAADAARLYVRESRAAADVARRAAADVERHGLRRPHPQEQDDAHDVFERALQRLDRTLTSAERMGEGLVGENAAGMRRLAERLGALLASPSWAEPSDARDFGTAANVWEGLVNHETAGWPPEERRGIGKLARVIGVDDAAGPPGDPGTNEADAAAVDPIAKALGIMAADSRKTVGEIADAVGVARSTLYRDDRFNSARRIMRGAKAAAADERQRRLPKGTKDERGNVEAWGG